MPGGNGAIVEPPGSVATAGMPPVAIVPSGVAAGVMVVERSVRGPALGVGGAEAIVGTDDRAEVKVLSAERVASGSVTSKLSVVPGVPGTGTGTVMPKIEAMTEPQAGGSGDGAGAVVAIAVGATGIDDGLLVPRGRAVDVRAGVLSAGTAVGQLMSVVV